MPVGQINHSIFPHTEAEAARLGHLHTLLSRILGGLPDLARYPRILDLGCGPGRWALEAANSYPLQQVVGVDDVPLMLTIAEEQALVAGSNAAPLSNVAFHLAPELTRLDFFKDGAFDFVHACRLLPKLRRDTWPALLRECWRVLAPNGTAQFTEWELPVTSSQACERYFEVIGQAYHRAEKALIGGSRSLGVLAALAHLARSAGFTVQCQTTLLDYSADSPDHADVLQNTRVALRHIQPFLLALGLLGSEEIGQLYEQAVVEMQAEDFVGGLIVLTVQGEKPGR